MDPNCSRPSHSSGPCSATAPRRRPAVPRGPARSMRLHRSPTAALNRGDATASLLLQARGAVRPRTDYYAWRDVLFSSHVYPAPSCADQLCAVGDARSAVEPSAAAASLADGSVSVLALRRLPRRPRNSGLVAVTVGVPLSKFAGLQIGRAASGCACPQSRESRTPADAVTAADRRRRGHPRSWRNAGEVTTTVAVLLFGRRGISAIFG